MTSMAAEDTEEQTKVPVRPVPLQCYTWDKRGELLGAAGTMQRTIRATDFRRSGRLPRALAAQREQGVDFMREAGWEVREDNSTQRRGN